MLITWVVTLILCGSSFAYWNKAMENPGLYGGDMELSAEQISSLHNGTLAYGSVIGRRWPGGRIPYIISGKLGKKARSAISEAINVYHKVTCLRFYPRKNNERAYINFYYGGSCSSPVGYEPNSNYKQRNDISLGSGCQNRGTVLHEVGHSLGLYHEQNRPDRDRYVTIHRNNILKDMYYNFQIERNVNSLGTPYDLRSIMHYSSTAFARDYRYRTISTKDPSHQHLINHGDSVSDLSNTDIKQINLMYNCKVGKVTTPRPRQTTPKATVQPPISGKCDNKDRDCEYWAREGYCTDKVEAQWMKENCCKACKAVVGQTCDDKDNRCYYWAREGYCTSTDNKYLQIMKDKCCLSCKTKARCADYDTKCPAWANRGECQKNPAWMKDNCKRSCKECL